MPHRNRKSLSRTIDVAVPKLRHGPSFPYYSSADHAQRARNRFRFGGQPVRIQSPANAERTRRDGHRFEKRPLDIYGFGYLSRNMLSLK
ncbi:hypothetical protein [Corynebacterium haemomassiliense]|uniref:Uncharacterized protein n=1 Tax=Corynebacterium haemomassiliense TaxID=2754726 RepID=A0A7W2E9E1_9CORY|nr:hypothetical protein [Corynebacterium haemomassiliense]MBA5243571.1 hypothetical protein [Corynebacterium haemomassiliense]